MTKNKLLRNWPLPLLFGFALGLSTLPSVAQGTYKEGDVRNGATIAGVVIFVGAFLSLAES